MIESLALILLCQLIGEVLVRLLHLPVPGPVIGMGLLFAGLVLRGGPPEKLEQTAGGLLSHLSLLFVPAGVGIMLHLDLILSVETDSRRSGDQHGADHRRHRLHSAARRPAK